MVSAGSPRICKWSCLALYCTVGTYIAPLSLLSPCYPSARYPRDGKHRQRREWTCAKGVSCQDYDEDACTFCKDIPSQVCLCSLGGMSHRNDCTLA